MDQSFITLCIEAMQALGGLGIILDERMETFPTDQQQKIVQCIFECFSSVVSSPYWTIRLHVMTSLVQFASTIPPKYKFILPKCVPTSMQKVLQCRLQKKVYLDDTTMNKNDVQILQQR
jgi:predicted membrane protein